MDGRAGLVEAVMAGMRPAQTRKGAISGLALPGGTANPIGRAAATGSGQQARPVGLADKASGLVDALMGAATLPGDVYAGRVNPNSDEAIRRSADLAGMATLGSGAMPAAANEMRMGIKAYHGSPHDFDKFDMGKIGAGEGAQVYGHGLYFADNPRVAQTYRDDLSPTFRRGSESLDASVKALRDAAQFSGQTEVRPMTLGGGKPGWMVFAKNGGPDPEILGVVQDLGNGRFYAHSDKNYAALENKGRMYEVDINAAPDEFLDWDKPLSQQSPAVQGFIEAQKEGFAAHYGKPFPDSAKGEQAVALLEGYIGRKEFADKLRDAGIKGVRYLDQGSRDAGAGTSNYVVFDDSIIDILKKYGIAGVTAGGAAAAAALPKDRPITTEEYQAYLKQGGA